MPARVRLLLPALLTILLAAVVGQTPVAAASPGRAAQPARSALGGASGLAHAARRLPRSAAHRRQPRTDLLPAPAHASGATLSGDYRSLADGTQPSRWRHHWFGSFGSALVGSSPVQPGPSAVAVDRSTDTIYVANGSNADGPTAPGGDTVSVINGRRCNALDVSRCAGPWPTVKVGSFPSTVAVDQATDTVYVTGGRVRRQHLQRDRAHRLRSDRHAEGPARTRGCRGR